LIVRSWLNVRPCQLSEPALISPHVGELTNEIEILNDEAPLARIASSAAYIHNSAALKASDGGPITATQILNFIPQVIKQFI
jgi:hypothetical protein